MAARAMPERNWAEGLAGNGWASRSMERSASSKVCTFSMGTRFHIANRVFCFWSQMTLQDKFGRQITDLRISVTDRCNFRCVYCRSADPENYRDHDQILSWKELERLAKVFL